MTKKVSTKGIICVHNSGGNQLKFHIGNNQIAPPNRLSIIIEKPSDLSIPCILSFGSFLQLIKTKIFLLF